MEIEAKQAEPIIGRTSSGATTITAHWAQVTIADGLYLLVLAAAAIMRFSSLGTIPLSPDEAQEALAAWRFLQPGPMTAPIGSPAYFTLTSLLMPLLGVSDTVARLVPALFGLGLVSLPWLLRGRLSNAGALVSAAFLAASPLNSVVARTAGGDAIALFALLLVLASVVSLQRHQSNRWYYVLAVSLALGVTSSPLFYGGLLTLALAWWVTKFTSSEPPRLPRPTRTTLINALLVSALVIVALSTRLLTYPAGLGASAQLFGDWLGQFGLSGTLEQTLSPFLSLARYEVALVFLGLTATLWAIWQSRTFGNMLTYWLLGTLGFLLLQNGLMSNALLVSLPGYLLVGLLSAYLLRWGTNRWTLTVTLGTLLIGATIFVNLTRYLRVSQFGQNLSNLWFVVLALGAGVLMVYYFWSMTNARVTQAIWFAFLLLLLAFEWGTAWQLTHVSANDPRERWVVEGTDDDLPAILQVLEEISRSATNSDADLDLLSAVDTPVLRWYLRDFWRASIGQTVPPQAKHQVIISAVGQEEPQFGSDYVGTDFGLLRTGTLTPPPPGAPISDVLRWWLFFESPVGLAEDRVVMWVRSDLVVPPQ